MRRVGWAVEFSVRTVLDACALRGQECREEETRWAEKVKQSGASEDEQVAPEAILADARARREHHKAMAETYERWERMLKLRDATEVLELDVEDVAYFGL